MDSIQLALSGHSGSLGFSGKNFSLNRDQLREFLARFPKSKEKIKTLYLLGCYTNNIGKLSHWLGNMRNLQRVYGYDLKSPLDAQLLGAEYAALAVAHNEMLEEMVSLEQIRDFLDRFVVRGTEGFYPVTAAIYGKVPCLEGNLDGEFYYTVYQDSTRSKITDMSGFMQECPALIQKYESEFKSVLSSYFLGHKDMLPLDHPMANDSVMNPVRKIIYPWANQHAHCLNDSFEISGRENLSLGQILNLIYFKTVQGNFFRYFAEETKELEAILASSNSSTAKSIQEDLSRRESLSRPGAVQLYGRFLQLQRELKNEGRFSEEKMQKISSFANRYKKFVRDLNDKCADIEWIEEKSEFRQPPAECL